MSLTSYRAAPPRANYVCFRVLNRGHRHNAGAYIGTTAELLKAKAPLRDSFLNAVQSGPESPRSQGQNQINRALSALDERSPALALQPLVAVAEKPRL